MNSMTFSVNAVALPPSIFPSMALARSPPSLRKENSASRIRASSDLSSKSLLDKEHSTLLHGRHLQVEDEKEPEEVVHYDWRKEWYPLYLAREVPDDGPLGLTVFDLPIVLYRDGDGEIRCFEDRCPHRLAKLSEGQVVDGKLECLYHGWQFEGDGKCVRIPQLPCAAKIPLSACARAYHVRDSQGVLWVWLSNDSPPENSQPPWFPNSARPGFSEFSSIHEFPYDHSILIENVMDPSHIPIAHDRTDFFARREDASPLRFKVMERTARGFGGWWGREDAQTLENFIRFQAPCVVTNDREYIDENGEKQYSSGVFLCRPTGQGKCMIIIRFGGTKTVPIMKFIPEWLQHQNACKIFEEDMGFLCSQNQMMMKEKLPTKQMYLNLKSSDVFVLEYRKWLDKVGHGMPYHVGHATVKFPSEPAVVEHAPAGLVTGNCASLPAKGGIGSMYAANMGNRYFRHVIHCKECSAVIKSLKKWKEGFTVATAVVVSLAILASGRRWKIIFLLFASLCLAGVYACTSGISFNTTNHVRNHRK